VSEVLFLAHRVPFPPDRGDRIRSWNIVKAIAKIAPVHVCALRDVVDAPDAGRAEIEAIAASCHIETPAYSKAGAMARALLSGGSASVAAFASPALQSAVDKVIAQHPISTIYAYSGQMAQFVPIDLGGRRFVMDFVDMDSAKFAAFGGFANRQEAKRLFAFEKAVAARADLSLFVSDAEAGLFRQQTGLGSERVTALENGIDLAKFDPSLPRISVRPEPFDFAQESPVEGHSSAAKCFDKLSTNGSGPLIVFTGQMDYRPNVDAVSAFARETMPLIRVKHPTATFAIVGRAPTAEVLSLASLPGVIVTGEVADTRDWLAAADVVVAPLKLARGIQNKILEAMAMGKAVVASPAAAEGIDAEIIVADGAVAEAVVVSGLLADSAKAQAIGKAARAQMIARYSWESRLAGLAGVLGV
jgi:polysaccharide biosynthesis protein PslH